MANAVGSSSVSVRKIYSSGMSRKSRNKVHGIILSLHRVNVSTLVFPQVIWPNSMAGCYMLTAGMIAFALNGTEIGLPPPRTEISTSPSIFFTVLD